MALCVVVRAAARGTLATCVLQMWAYLAMYEMPADDPEALEARVHMDGLPGSRGPRARVGRGSRACACSAGSQGRFPDIRRPERVLVWAHWIWFLVPHGTALYVLARRRDRFPRAAAMIYATFDLGVICYWVIPTAPPWYAAEHGRFGSDAAPLRRLMLDYGEQFWPALGAPSMDWPGIPSPPCPRCTSPPR